MEIKKFRRGDRLQLVLMGLAEGESVSVPYRYHSLNSIRATASQLKSAKGASFTVDARPLTAAVVTRTA